MYIVGIDLSGPTNTQDTAYACFTADNGRLRLDNICQGATDAYIYEQTAALAARGSLVVGLDAPLSYNPGGGDRPSDKALRRAIVAAGLRASSIMTPTMTRMAYLTLRGITVARLLQSLAPQPQIVEVHPGAALALHGAPVTAVRIFKQDAAAQGQLLCWLEAQGMNGVASIHTFSDHSIAACGGDKGDKDKAEGACGEGSCGGDKDKAEGACGEGSCGGDKDEAEEDPQG
jgi:predicted nuclease with RNAse H fold